MKDRTDRDFFAAVYLGSRRYTKNLDRASRIVPALFFQPHFGSPAYSLSADDAGHTILSPKEYDDVANSPIFRYFKYIKTFTPMRRITTSYRATMRFMWAFPVWDDFKGKPVDVARAMEWIDQFTTSNYYIRESWRKNVLADVKVEKDGQLLADDEQEKSKEAYLEQRMEKIRLRRISMAKSLLRNLHFVNKKGQPLQMMPKLELDPALLEQPLHH